MAEEVMLNCTPEGYGLGYRPDLPDIRDHLHAASPDAIASTAQKEFRLPAKYMPRIWNQASIGSCTAHGWAFLVEYELRKAGFADTPKMVEPSRLMIYYDERWLEGTVSSDAGAYVRDGAKAINKWGVAHARLWPYEDVVDNFRKKPPQKAYDDAAKYKGISYARVQQTQQQLQGTLLEGWPITFGFTVYESFESQSVAANGVVPMPQVGEQVLGGHCVVIIGWTIINGRLYYIIRNSWDTSWGDKGLCYMPAEYIHSSRLASDFWVLTLVS